MSDAAEIPASGSPTAATPEPAPAGATAPLSATTGRKKKRRSRDLAALHEVERAASKATHRVAQAVEKGVAAYRKKRARAARKKRDGALRDFPVNVAHGVAETVRAAAKAPADLAGALDAREVRKLLRRGVRIALSPFSR